VIVSASSALRRDDPEIADLVERERQRQETTLSLIASESSTTEAVLEALGSIFDDKTAEGYPGRRYHRGTAIADELETLAIERAKALWGADHANVQVHSGVNANVAVYRALLRPADPVLAMALDHGGHLSHGASASLTGQVYGFHHYGVRADTELIDYEEVARLAMAHRPRLLVAGGSSYPRLIDYERLRAIADKVGAWLHVDMAHIAGLVAAGVIPSPVPHADVVTMTTYKTLLGPHGGLVLCRAEHASAIDRAVFPGTQGAPGLSQVAAKAVCLHRASTPAFADIQATTLAHAAVLGRTLADCGWRLVAGGTDTHMVLVDVRSRGLTGDRAETVLEEAGILANRNAIPFDPEPISRTSGLRLGAGALAVRGFTAEEVVEVSELIDAVLGGRREGAAVRHRVEELCRTHPLG
jgi:glycine hydroxymethyltransferase